MAPVLDDLLRRRLILVSGKGGVGKTTAAALLTRLASRLGRVLCVELTADADAFSPLSHALGDRLSGEQPTELAPGIDGVLITPQKGFLRFFEQVLPARWMARAALKSKVIRRFLVSAPAFAETGALLRLLDLVGRTDKDGAPRYRTVVVDLPATGHALALAQLPRMLLRVVSSGPLRQVGSEGLALLTDPRRCGAVVVSIGEELPVSEALELVAGLRRSEIPVIGVLVNRVPRDPFDEAERAEVERLLAEHGPALGGELVARIARARVAEARLQQPDLEVARLAERGERGAALSAALAEEHGR